jgi:hypothetical protein
MDMRTARPDDAPRISALVRDLTCKYIAHEFSEQGAGRLLEPMSEAAIEGYLESIGIMSPRKTASWPA